MLDISIRFLEPFLLQCNLSREDDRSEIAGALGAEFAELRPPAQIADGTYLVGPQIGVSFERVGSGFRISASNEAECSEDIAWALGVGDEAGDPIMLRYWVPQPKMDGLAGLMREHLLLPGTAVVVPRGTSTIVLAHPEPKKLFLTSVAFCDRRHFPQSIEPVSEPQRHARRVSDLPERSVDFAQPLLDADPAPLSAQLDSSMPWVQIGPIMEPSFLIEVMRELENAPWMRRHGPGYTQDALNFIAWTDSGAAPRHSKQLAKALRSPIFAERIGLATGTPWRALLEVSAYRFRQGDAIRRHADGTVGGRMRLRVNLILCSPDPDEDDFVFYADGDTLTPVMSFRGKGNTAVCFLIGDQTPHEVPGIRDDQKGSRINFVMTYGPLGMDGNTDYSRA